MVVIALNPSRAISGLHIYKSQNRLKNQYISKQFLEGSGAAAAGYHERGRRNR